MDLVQASSTNGNNRVDVQTLSISLSSEITGLNEILDILPAENTLERLGFEERLSSAQKQLASLEANV